MFTGISRSKSQGVDLSFLGDKCYDQMPPPWFPLGLGTSMGFRSCLGHSLNKGLVEIMTLIFIKNSVGVLSCAMSQELFYLAREKSSSHAHVIKSHNNVTFKMHTPKSTLE